MLSGLLNRRSRIQTPVGPTLRFCLCNDIRKRLVLSRIRTKTTVTVGPVSQHFYLISGLWDVKEPTPLIEKSRGRRPTWGP